MGKGRRICHRMVAGINTDVEKLKVKMKMRRENNEN
jgi:hypothetical protein